MTVSKQTSYRGRKAKIGKLMFHNNRMMFFLGYHVCDTCNNQGKVLVNMDEARQFANSIGHAKVPLKQKFAQFLIRKYAT